MNGLYRYFIEHKTVTLSIALFWTVGIFIGCSMPGKDLPSIHLFDRFDKVVHFTFFGVFFVLWFMYFHALKHVAWYVLGMTVLYGFGIEFYQLHCVAGRAFDVWDGLADSVGGLLGWVFVRRFATK